MTEQDSLSSRREEIISTSPFLRTFLYENQEVDTSKGADAFIHVCGELIRYYGEDIFESMLVPFREMLNSATFVTKEFSEKDTFTKALLVMGYEIGNKNDTNMFASQIMARFVQLDNLDEDVLYSEEAQASPLAFINAVLNTGAVFQNEIMMRRVGMEKGKPKKKEEKTENKSDAPIETHRLKPFENFIKGLDLDSLN